MMMISVMDFMYKIINITLTVDVGMVTLANVTHLWSKRVIQIYKIDQREVWQCPYHSLIALLP
jgi:hypothetical protein